MMKYSEQFMEHIVYAFAACMAVILFRLILFYEQLPSGGTPFLSGNVT